MRHTQLTSTTSSSSSRKLDRPLGVNGTSVTTIMKTIARSIISALGFEIRRKSTTSAPPLQDDDLPNPIRRRFPGGRLKGLPAWFFELQDRELAETVLPRAWSLGEADRAFNELSPILENRGYSELGERMVEYPWAIWNIARLAHGGPYHLADAGCVMNRGIVVDYVLRACEMVWFMNPAQERLAYTQRAAYVIGDVREHRLPESNHFSVITCLSTLEHVGMDTKRYGGPGGEVNVDVDRPEKNAIPMLNALYDLLVPGGSLLISIPYGPFEYVYDYDSELPAYYTFDRSRADALLAPIVDRGADVDSIAYKVVPNRGWVKTSLDDEEILPYAERCAGAGGTLLIVITKPSH
jgi:hypothetical protein